MPKQHFFMRLLGPRPTFATDMTAGERALMMQHGAYIAEHFAAGKVLAYGPVFDPQGSFGMGILEVSDLAEAQSIADADPSILAGMNHYTLAPMHLAGCQPSPKE